MLEVLKLLLVKVWDLPFEKILLDKYTLYSVRAEGILSRGRSKNFSISRGGSEPILSKFYYFFYKKSQNLGEDQSSDPPRFRPHCSYFSPLNVCIALLTGKVSADMIVDYSMSKILIHSFPVRAEPGRIGGLILP